MEKRRIVPLSFEAILLEAPRRALMDAYIGYLEPVLVGSTTFFVSGEREGTPVFFGRMVINGYDDRRIEQFVAGVLLHLYDMCPRWIIS